MARTRRHVRTTRGRPSRGWSGLRGRRVEPIRAGMTARVSGPGVGPAEINPGGAAWAAHAPLPGRCLALFIPTKLASSLRPVFG